MRFSLLSVALLCALASAVALLVFQAGHPFQAPQVRYACPTEFSAKALYVAPEGKGYIEQGGTSDDPAVANAYNFGALYGACQN